jgi:flagellar hook-associated protein 1 FlgK
VANAQTPGYVRKSMQPVTSAAGDGGSVRLGTINRELDQYVQRQLRVETAGGAYAELRASFYQRLQGLYGAPGSDSSLETSFNNFTESLQSLITSTDSAAARSVALSSAQVLAQTLNSLTTDIQALRGDAESGLADSAATANNAMEKIAQLNQRLAGLSQISPSDSVLLDQRDSYIDQLSELMDIRVVTDGRNQVNIFTNSGIQLVGSEAAHLSFTPQGTVGASTLWDSDPAKSNLGSLLLTSASGASVDLIATNSIRSGKIAA